MPLLSLPTTLAEAEDLDSADPLRSARKHFSLPEGVIYLDGHSLGPATHAALERLYEGAFGDWRNRLIRSWNEAGWIDLPERLGARIAGLIGVEATDVVVCDSVSVNLFKLAAAALEIAPRKRLLVEEGEFPTDQYVAEGIAALCHVPLERIGPHQALEALSMGGLLIKSAVNYRTGGAGDIAAHEAAARAGGALILWDLSHAAGVLDLRLRRDGASLAAGCGYKFLNGGPGAPAYVYVRGDLAERLATPLRGWFGHAQPFAFQSTYAPRAGVARFAAGTPPILSCLALYGALDAFEGVSLSAVEAKARALGGIWMERAAGLGLDCITPPAAGARGAHVAVVHEEGYAVIQALIARGVIGDFRAPDVMRFGFSPLFLSFAEVWRAFDILEDVLGSGSYRDPAYSTPAKVT